MARDNERGQSSYPFELHVRITPAYAGELLKLAEEMGHEADVAVVPLTEPEPGSDHIPRGFRLVYASPQICRSIHDALALRTGGLAHHDEPMPDALTETV